MSKYFYKLGFNPAFGQSEFNFLSTQKTSETDFKWLFSNELIDVNQTGSLVFAGEIFIRFPKSELKENFSNVFQDISRFLTSVNSENNEYKKVGFSLSGNIFQKNADKKFLEVLKSSGSKKVNLLPTGLLPNFGNFKNTNKWLILVETDTELFFGRVVNFANQEFWSNLDLDLPKRDMKRGIMNLKLARSLMNFSSSKNVWDPFCGQGRTILSGLDFKENLWASDIDSKCLLECDKNLEFARGYFERRRLGNKNEKLEPVAAITLSPFVNNNNSAQTAVSPLTNENNELGSTQIVQNPQQQTIAPILSQYHSPAFELDAQNLDLAGLHFKNLAIVTEGFLGYNFTNSADTAKMSLEWGKLEILWKAILAKASSLEIPEIVFCLPFYQMGAKKFLPEFYQSLTSGTKYQFHKLDQKEDYLLYSRTQSFVGHFVLKVVLA